MFYIHNNFCLELSCHFISYTKQLVDISLAIIFAGMMFGLCINYKVQGSPHESHTLKAKKLYDFQTLSQRWSKQQIVVMNDWGKEFFLLLCCNLFGKNFVSTVHALVFLGHRTKHVNACQHLHYVTMCELSSWPIVRELMKVAVRPWSKVRASYKVIKKPALYCGGSLCFWLLFR